MRITRIGDRLALISVADDEPMIATAPGGALTTAERSVVGLAVSGLSNAEIARARASSPRSIANQLAMAYRKLGVSGRRELRARLRSARGAPR